MQWFPIAHSGTVVAFCFDFMLYFSRNISAKVDFVLWLEYRKGDSKSGAEMRENVYFKSLWGGFAALPEVEAIALGGLRTDSDRAWQTIRAMINELEKVIKCSGIN